MSYLYRYFAAATDEEAARTLADGPLEALDVSGIDPIVQLGTLEELLTGRTFTEILHDERSGHDVAMEDDGAFVVTLTEPLRTALSAASAEQLQQVAGPWAETEEFFGSATGEQLLPFLTDLAALARRGPLLYCWVSP